jgi:hypothetical protein
LELIGVKVEWDTKTPEDCLLDFRNKQGADEIAGFLSRAGKIHE